MPTIAELKPIEIKRVIDLVQQAGIDISNWGNFKGGTSKAASNPKYCYEWCFTNQQTVVLNLWYANLLEQEGAIIQQLNLRKVAEEIGREPNSSARQRRATDMDVALQTAWRKNLPIRVILCDGSMRGAVQDSDKASQVKARRLDPLSWTVAAYDWESGDCVVARREPTPGIHSENVLNALGRQHQIHSEQPAPKNDKPNIDVSAEEMYVDQFSHAPSEGEKRFTAGEVFVRSKKVRKYALQRAQGKCEWCGVPGFATSINTIYLETHHVIPLWEGGVDHESNVVALCANHHRKVHSGKNSVVMRKSLLEKLLGLKSTDS